MQLAFGLRNRLNSQTAKAGRFHSGYTDTRVRGPDLHVSDVGFISLPLTQTVQDQLRRCCQQDNMPAQPERQAQTWQLDASRVAASNPGTSFLHSGLLLLMTLLLAEQPFSTFQSQETYSGWETTVSGLAVQRSKGLGLACTEGIQASLQKVSLIGDCNSCHVDPKEDPPPGTFATMVVLLLPANTVCELRFVVQCASPWCTNVYCCHAVTLLLDCLCRICWVMALQGAQAFIHEGSQTAVDKPQQANKVNIAPCQTSFLSCIAFFTGTACMLMHLSVVCNCLLPLCIQTWTQAAVQATAVAMCRV